jgi:hypothetical protein
MQNRRGEERDTEIAGTYSGKKKDKMPPWRELWDSYGVDCEVGSTVHEGNSLKFSRQ